MLSALCISHRPRASGHQGGPGQGPAALGTVIPACHGLGAVLWVGHTATQLEASEGGVSAALQKQKHDHSIIKHVSTIDMLKHDVGKRFMKYKGTITSATLYFTS